MYVELGSGNGGIVVNLGTDGVACQAANRVTTPPNTNLRIRLRGSGLNTEVDGNLVWLGKTQKEVGISFKEVSSDARQSIEDWITREFHQSGETVSADLRAQSKMVPILPAMPRTEKRVPGHPLSAALSAPQATSAEILPPADTSVKETVSGLIVSSTLSPTLPAATEPSTARIALESDEALQNARVLPIIDSVKDSKVEIAASAVPVQQPAITPALPRELASEISSTERAAETMLAFSSPHVVAENPVIAPSQKAAPAPQPAQAEASELSKKKEPIPSAKAHSFEAWKRLVESAELEKWIPPALLHIWHNANRRHRIALAGTAGVVVLSFFLVLIFAAGSFVSHSSGNGSAPQSAASSATTNIGPGDVRDTTAQARPRANVVPPPDNSDDSVFTNWIRSLFGDKPNERTAVALDGGRVGVQVWTSKTSGYYYCIDQPFYKNVRPGAYMTQRDALQSGYQPKLGQFCD